MSQNSQSLLLFFDDEAAHKNCLLMLLRLSSSENEQAQLFSNRLGVDITSAWEDDWFNHNVVAQPQYIRVDYDTSTGYNLPLDVLEQLFKCGLKGAAIEVFYDQVGEFAQYYFMERKLVDKETLTSEYPIFEALTESQFECALEDLEDEGVDKPVSIAKLIKDEGERHDESVEMVESIRELAKLSRETGKNPLEVLRAALVMRALGKGVGYALLFGVATVLLFKGMWLWISLTVILLIVLPIYFVSIVSKEFDDDEDDAQEEGATAC